MEFGVFDHLDRDSQSLPDYYEARLQLIEAYDRSGFYGYHVAEHHATPLGMAPSPNIFLSAIAQRTRQLRFGPMVYVVPTYNPLRLLEEICMLDQMSRGRLEIAFGRGASPFELGYYGQKYEEAQEVYEEGLELVLKGMSERTLTFHGSRFNLDEMPLQIEPYQKPHPPMWYGATSPTSAERAARKGFNILSLGSADGLRTLADAYRAAWHEANGAAVHMPKIGLSRFVVVAETDEAALAVARPAYLKWYYNFNWLYRRHGRGPMSGERCPDFDCVMQERTGIAGSPSTVAAYLRQEIESSSANYLVGQFAFGDMPPAAALRSVQLFSGEVMPELRREALAVG